MKILLADDEEVVRIVGAEVLSNAGYEVVLAEDGQAAVELFEQHAQEWAVVILDVAMPHLTGDQVFDYIHRRRPDLPVALATGFSADEIDQRFGDKNVAGFLHKPFPCDDLIDLVTGILEKERPPRTSPAGE